MDQEAEAMKTKKILWPWAERQVKGKKEGFWTACLRVCKYGTGQHRG